MSRHVLDRYWCTTSTFCSHDRCIFWSLCDDQNLCCKPHLLGRYAKFNSASFALFHTLPRLSSLKWNFPCGCSPRRTAQYIFSNEQNLIHWSECRSECRSVCWFGIWFQMHPKVLNLYPRRVTFKKSILCQEKSRLYESLVLGARTWPVTRGKGVDGAQVYSQLT